MREFISKCGRVKLYNGDCRELMGSFKFDLCVSDPPSNVDFETEGDAWDEYAEILRHTLIMPMVMIHYPEETVKLSWAFEEVPRKIVGLAYPHSAFRQCRLISWWCCAPDQDKLSRLIGSETLQCVTSDWWAVNYDMLNVKHRRQAAVQVQIMEKIISVTPGETVFDPYMGLGETGVAAIRQGRKFIGIERSSLHFDMAVLLLKCELNRTA